MITKERLEELIGQGATVCNAYKDWDNVWHCRFGNVVQEENHLLFKENGSSLSVIMHDTNNLYETKEQAEWEWEFGCIERTERLVLPTWEELSRDLKDVPAGTYVIKEFDDVSLEYIKYNEVFIGIYKGDYEWKEWEATKENYTLACRKAKELFLGKQEVNG